jgi:hypothetical protein
VPVSGRYLPDDGSRVFRMDVSNIVGAYSSRIHVVFENLRKKIVNNNLQIYLTH